MDACWDDRSKWEIYNEKIYKHAHSVHNSGCVWHVETYLKILDFPKKRDKTSRLMRNTQRQVSFHMYRSFGITHIKCHVIYKFLQILVWDNHFFSFDSKSIVEFIFVFYGTKLKRKETEIKGTGVSILNFNLFYIWFNCSTMWVGRQSRRVCFGAKPDKGFLDMKSRRIRKW